MINGQRINASVKADRAHGLTQGEYITIAIIDDGFDIDHPEFKIPGKVVHSRDSTKETTDPRPTRKDENHGTCCAASAQHQDLKIRCCAESEFDADPQYVASRFDERSGSY